MIGYGSDNFFISKDNRMWRRYEEAKRLNRQHVKIRKNEYPICDSKLERGKRDKHNDYKRSWVCKSCYAVYTI